MKLNQVLAIEKGTSSKAQSALTEFYKQCQAATLSQGLVRKYKPNADDGERLAPENKQLQLHVATEFKSVLSSLKTQFDLVATKDKANCSARADVVVGGKTILADVPVTTLLFLEKQLTDMHTAVTKLPILPTDEKWSFDEANDMWVSEPLLTTKTKPIKKVLEKSPATDKHPAQVEVYEQAEPVGVWTTIKHSGCVKASAVKTMRENLEKLLAAVKVAREEANLTPAVEVSIADAVFASVLAGVELR